MSLENPDTQKIIDKELALKQAEIEKMKLELELKKMEQQTQSKEMVNASDSEPSEEKRWYENLGILTFFTMFFPPLAIYGMCKWPQFKKHDDGTRNGKIAIVLTKITYSIVIMIIFALWCALLYTFFFATLDLFG